VSPLEETLTLDSPFNNLFPYKVLKSSLYRFNPFYRMTAFKKEFMDTQAQIKEIVTSHPVVLFMKGTAQFPQCGFSGNAINILKASGVEKLHTVNVLEDAEIRQGIKEYANWPTIPQLYINGEFIGGSDILTEMYQSGELQKLIKA
jgi:monothiol glutaredoxin